MLSIHSRKHIRCISRRGDFGPIFSEKKCGLYPGKYGINLKRNVNFSVRARVLDTVSAELNDTSFVMEKGYSFAAS